MRVGWSVSLTGPFRVSGRVGGSSGPGVFYWGLMLVVVLPLKLVTLFGYYLCVYSWRAAQWSWRWAVIGVRVARRVIRWIRISMRVARRERQRWEQARQERKAL